MRLLLFKKIQYNRLIMYQENTRNLIKLSLVVPRKKIPKNGLEGGGRPQITHLVFLDKNMIFIVKKIQSYRCNMYQRNKKNLIKLSLVVSRKKISKNGLEGGRRPQTTHLVFPDTNTIIIIQKNTV